MSKKHGTTNSAARPIAGPDGARTGRRAGLQNLGLCFSAIGLLALLAGCVTKQAVQKQVRDAYQAGFQQGRATAEADKTLVFFDGPFRQRQIAWRPNLTLAEAIVEAAYTAPTDPKSIIVTRDNRPLTVDPDDLLRGVNFLLEPGDVVHLIP